MDTVPIACRGLADVHPSKIKSVHLAIFAQSQVRQAIFEIWELQRSRRKVGHALNKELQLPPAADRLRKVGGDRRQQFGDAARIFGARGAVATQSIRPHRRLWPVLDSQRVEQLGFFQDARLLRVPRHGRHVLATFSYDHTVAQAVNLLAALPF